MLVRGPAPAYYWVSFILMYASFDLLFDLSWHMLVFVWALFFFNAQKMKTKIQNYVNHMKVLFLD